MAGRGAGRGGGGVKHCEQCRMDPIVSPAGRSSAVSPGEASPFGPRLQPSVVFLGCPCARNVYFPRQMCVRMCQRECVCVCVTARTCRQSNCSFRLFTPVLHPVTRTDATARAREAHSARVRFAETRRLLAQNHQRSLRRFGARPCTWACVARV